MGKSEFKVSDIAEVICRAEGRTDLEKVYNQLRSLAAKRLISKPGAKEVYGPHGALLYGADSVFRARILLSLVDLGFEAERLNTVYSSAFSQKEVLGHEGEDARMDVFEVVRNFPGNALGDLVLQIGISFDKSADFGINWCGADGLDDDTEVIVLVNAGRMFDRIRTCLASL